ncbi:MAG TPA: carboxymuconolactone decarboxylase family protein [Allosphingosinicella sp.]|nr:carboxymuconolactone decarboxylase family protein [Allosphingosinicella sp.]
MIFPSLPDDASVRHAFRLNPAAGKLLSEYHQLILRGPSPLSVADRELIAAYVSGLNRCNFCHGTHLAAAELFGVSGDLVRTLVADCQLAAAPEELRPLLAYARKLTLDHNRIVAEDAQKVFDAGWSERALHDLILVAATFNFMNRFVHGHGIEGNDALHAERGRYLFESGYAGVAEASPDPERP